MNKKNLQKLSLYSFIISAVTFIFTFYFYHFVTDSGFTLTYHKEPGKPFISNLLGQFAVLFLFMSVAALLISHIFYNEQEKKD